MRPPSNLKEESGWKEFKSLAEAYLTYLDKDYRDELTMAAKAKQELDLVDMSDPTETRALNLFAMLTSWTASNAEARIAARAIKDQNGYLLWQRLVSMFEPRILSKPLVWRRQLLHPTLPTKEGDFQGALADWEADVGRYEEETGGEIEDDDERGVLLEVAPKSLEQHLQQNLDDLDTYEKMKSKIASYHTSKKK